MRFHLPSFLLGVVTGAAGRSLWDRFRPVMDELAAAGGELRESLWNRAAVWQEDAEDAIAAARTRGPRRETRRPRAARRARPARSRR